MLSFTTSLHSVEQQVFVAVTINQISQLKSIRSNLIMVNDLPWQIEIFRNGESRKSVKDGKDGETLGVSLYCLNCERWNWSCAATVAIQLHSLKPNQPPHKNVILPWVFSAEDNVSSNMAVIRWTDLFDADARHVFDDQIKMDFKIFARTVNAIEPQELRLNQLESTTQMILRINSIDKLSAVSTNFFTLGQLPWKIVVRKNQCTENESFLGLVLRCINRGSSNWTRNLATKFTVRGSQTNYSQSFKEVQTFNNHMTVSFDSCHGMIS